jgi:adenylosuccinate synthase
MTITLVLGTQWGDEGKGKMIDLLAGEADLVLRFAGGANAGHTIVTGGETYKFHLLPSGVLRPEKTVALGNGMVIDPGTLIRELDGLESRGGSGANVRISDRAHLILPYHRVLDALEEAHKAHMAGEGATIGTTRRGIGPAYAGKVRRSGIRFCDLASGDDDALRDKLTMDTTYMRGIFGHLGKDLPDGAGPPGDEIEGSLDVDSLMGLCKGYREALGGRVVDVATLAAQVREEGGDILLEGAQGAMLDIDHGSYPFVTSSNCTAGGACTGSGIGPRHIDRVLGVVKAYTTRVGGGPMVTELTDEVGARMQEVGHEFGTTTSRPRRCGWLDLVVLRRAVAINSIDALLITKIDVLGDMDELKVCTAYECDGETRDTFPADLDVLARCTPVYTAFPGWSSAEVKEAFMALGSTDDPGSDAGASPGQADPGIQERAYGGMPKGLRDYVQFIADEAGVPVDIVSVGPARTETFDLRGCPVKPKKA